MAQEKKSYLAVLPDGREYFVESAPALSGREAEKLCADAVAFHGLTTSRRNPSSVTVELFSLGIVCGELLPHKITACTVMPPIGEMTDTELVEELKAVTSELPAEFAEAIQVYAYTCDHASGNDERLSVARSLVAQLLQPVVTYRQRITRDLTRSNYVD